MLDLRDTSFEYLPDRPVLRAVSASFPAGRLTAIVGPNGAGKSTLLRILLGVLTPTSGQATMTIAGGASPIDRLPAARRAASLAYIPQQPATPESFTAEQVVRLGRLARPANDGAVVRAMQRTETSDLRRELFQTLSAGQRQRFALARALAQLDDPAAPPQAILADEPCAAMDPRHALASMGILREEADKGRVVIVVLHDLTTALRFAHHALVLDAAGRCVAHGAAAATLTPATLAPVYQTDFVLLRADNGPGALVPR